MITDMKMTCLNKKMTSTKKIFLKIQDQKKQRKRVKKQKINKKINNKKLKNKKISKKLHKMTQRGQTKRKEFNNVFKINLLNLSKKLMKMK